jgi:steroid delta-isomerase-like uncharacterized protein
MRTTSALFVLATTLAAAACGGEEQQAPPPQPPPAVASVETPPPPATTSTPEPPPKPPITDREKAAMQTAMSALNAHDAKAFSAVYADDAVISVAGLNDVTGRDAIAANIQDWFDTFGDVKVGFNRVWMTGADVVLLEWVINGTYSGGLFGVKATNTPIGHTGLSVLWFDGDGHVKAEHRYGDLGTVMTQVGATKQAARPIPPLPAAPQVAAASGSSNETTNLATAKALYASIEQKAGNDFLGMLADDIEYDGIIHLATVKGKAEGKKFFQTVTGAFPDLKFAIANSWSIGDDAIVEYVMTGTQNGPLGTLATSKRPIRVHAVDVLHMKDGKISRAATYSNSLEMMSELGLFQPKK